MTEPTSAQPRFSVQNRIADRITLFAGSMAFDAKRQVVADQQWQTVHAAARATGE